MVPSLLSFCIDMFAVALFSIYVTSTILIIGITPMQWIEQVIVILSMPVMLIFSLGLALVIGKARLHGLKKETIFFDCAGLEWMQMGTVLPVGWMALMAILPRVVPIYQVILMAVPVIGWFTWSLVFTLLFPLLYIVNDKGLWVRSWGAFYSIPFSEIVAIQFLPESHAMLPSPNTRPITRWHNYVCIEYRIGPKMARRVWKKYLTPSDPALLMETLHGHMARHQQAR
ncbi:MAG: hypothetical protein BWY25_01714 [Chloroflexi bacterium ADurb.Bin222]|nr:MAG: hypothetical protein BWY25_01714 [Chloroflexi bacterium ADurb.Bin222]